MTENDMYVYKEGPKICVNNEGCVMCMCVCVCMYI